MSITKLTSESNSPPTSEESYCFCNDEISLQMISGGAALEGHRGRVTLLLDDDVYVDYIRKDLYDSEVATKNSYRRELDAYTDFADRRVAALHKELDEYAIENEAVKKANIDCVDHFNAVLQDLKLSEDLRKANLEQYTTTIEKFKINYQMLHDFATQHKISYVDLFVMVEKATGIQQPLR
jgi:hypothetical protein